MYLFLILHLEMNLVKWVLALFHQITLCLISLCLITLCLWTLRILFHLNLQTEFQIVLLYVISVIPFIYPFIIICLVANKCKKYVPPKRELTMEFARNILSGEKKLLDLEKVNWIQDIPQIKGLSTQRMWNELRNDKTVIMYFPNYSRTRLPSKNYLMNVILISFYYPFQVINTL